MLTITLSFCGITLLLLAAVVIYSNYRVSANRWLGAFTVSGFMWLLANLLANIATTDSTYLLFSRLALVGSSLIPFTFLLFCLRFTNRGTGSAIKLIALFVPTLILLLSTSTSWNIKSASVKDSSLEAGPAYVLLLIVIVFYFAYGIRLLVQEYRRSKQRKRQQLYYILAGTMLTVVPGFIMSGMLPLLGQYQAVSYAPAIVIFFPIFTTIAIVKHRLFDVRLIIARSLGYAISVLALSGIYGFIVFGIANYAFNLHFSILVQVFLSITTGFSGLAFPYFKRTFDRITNKFFYRDAYEPQELFDHLNRTLVSSLNLTFLLKQTSSIVVENLKSEFAFFGIKDNLSESYRIEGTIQPKYNGEDIAKVRSLTSKISQSVLIVDLLDEKHEDLKRILNRNNVAILVQLATNAHKKTEESLGFIALGPKKSGNPYNSQDVRVLDTVANELIIAIQNALHFEEIQRFNITLQAKVQDATQQLRRTNTKLEALDETKDDFISMASHQLRTPLTSVKGYLSMVLDGDAGKVSDTQRKMLNQAFISSQRMVYLIADLLNVSRLKTGKFIIDPSPTDLSKLITEEVSQLVETAESRELKLTYSKPARFPVLQLDETKTRQVIMNFIDNAIYYTPPGGHIDVQLIDKGVSIELRVVDDGIGVPSSEQYHLFTKFYRARNAQKARPDGTGLGLFMAKKVIVAQGGAIIFESKEGKGSTFGFSFSKAKLETPTSVIAPIVTKVPAAVK